MAASKTKKFNLGLCFTAYDLWKTGLSDNQVAAHLGVSATCLKKWLTDKKTMAAARRRATETATSGESKATWSEYIVSRLPEDLYDIWEELVELNEGECSVADLEKCLKDSGRVGRQRLALQALLYHNYDLGKALRFCNIDRRTWNSWKQNDPDFGRLVEEIDELKGDLFEGALIRLVQEGCPAAVIHTAKSYNAKRGYSPEYKMEHSGDIAHTVDLLSLNLPPEVLRQIKAAMDGIKNIEGTESPASVKVMAPTARTTGTGTTALIQ